MPPKKKAAVTADVDANDASSSQPATTRTTRASTRVKTPASTASASKAKVPASKAKPSASKAKASTTKGKSKRAHTESGDEEEEPATKKKKTLDPALDKKEEEEEQNKQEEQEEEEKDEEDDAPKKMVTIVKRGAAPVDPMSGLVYTHQVLSNAEGIWDAMLNQTDVTMNANKNKFYVIQLLHPISNPDSCTLYTRWGRVGENGQSQSKGPWGSSQAIQLFKSQFKSKTATNWESRVGMTVKKGKYMWLERSFEDDEKDKDKEEGGSGGKEDVIIPDSKLDPELRELCELIFSTKLIDAHLSSMNYDSRKLPLGKLAKSTILSGFAALKVLSDVLDAPDGARARELGGLQAACAELSGAYYSIIPHDFGRNRPQIINNKEMLKRELELVDALGDMEIASKLIQSNVHTDSAGNTVNPLDGHFLSLGLTSMEPVKGHSDEFKALETYVRDTHGATHHHLQVKVMHAYRVERQAETDAWNNAGYDSLGDGERLLLWHGSRTTNFAGILKQGLRIAPPEAPVTGYMFGKGVYFADMMSKSAGYCYSQLSNNTGLLLLCEVAAVPFYEQMQANYDADRHCKAANKLCTKGIGRTQPTAWKDAGASLGHDTLTGCKMPDGPGNDVPIGGYLQYNEYIVYDASQIRLRYLLMVQM